jgi:hypothetical protein
LASVTQAHAIECNRLAIRAEDTSAIADAISMR